MINTKVIFIIIFFSFISSAQPIWVTETPSGYANDYFVGRGFSLSSSAEATQIAMQDALTAIIRNGNITIRGTEEFTEVKTETFQNNSSTNLESIAKLAREIIVEGSSVTISNLKHVETYVTDKRGYFNSYVLVSIPKKNPTNPPSAFSPIWRSTLIPGWGQLYKGQPIKGITFFTLTVGGIVGGFVFNQLSLEAASSASSSRTQVRRDFFNNEKKSYHTYSIISFIGAALFYSWNFADAIMTKQDNLYVEISPTDKGLGINLCINF